MTLASTGLENPIALWQENRISEALEALQKAAEQPDVAARAYAMQAVLLRNQSRFDEALAAAVKALRLDIALLEAWEVLGFVLLKRKKWLEARQFLSNGVQVFPDQALLLSFYAMALTKTGAYAEAYRHARKALHIAPDLFEAALATTEVLHDAGHYDRALCESEKLHQKFCNDITAFLVGANAFIAGDFFRGLRLLAKGIDPRWQGPELPEWQGQDAMGKHIILYCGQGFGDIIQFARYADYALRKAAKVSLRVPASLAGLMRDSFPELTIIAEQGGDPKALSPLRGANAPEMPEDAAFRCSLFSLATLGGGSFDPQPRAMPTLRADAAKTEAWKNRLAAMPQPRIGIVWSSPMQKNNPSRAISFAELQPLLDIAKEHLVSLQLGPEALLASEAGIFDASPFIADFSDSAALMGALDLIITLDSAPAHLAGALGKPVWVMLPFAAEWRWLIAREDSIWYPSMRLFRQDSPQNWGNVMENMGNKIKQLLEGDRSPLLPPEPETQVLRRHPAALDLPFDAT